MSSTSWFDSSKNKAILFGSILGIAAIILGIVFIPKMLGENSEEEQVSEHGLGNDNELKKYESAASTSGVNLENTNELKVLQEFEELSKNPKAFEKLKKETVSALEEKLKLRKQGEECVEMAKKLSEEASPESIKAVCELAVTLQSKNIKLPEETTGIIAKFTNKGPDAPKQTTPTTPIEKTKDQVVPQPTATLEPGKVVPSSVEPEKQKSQPATGKAQVSATTLQPKTVVKPDEAVKIELTTTPAPLIDVESTIPPVETKPVKIQTETVINPVKSSILQLKTPKPVEATLPTETTADPETLTEVISPKEEIIEEDDDSSDSQSSSQDLEHAEEPKSQESSTVTKKICNGFQAVKNTTVSGVSKAASGMATGAGFVAKPFQFAWNKTGGRLLGAVRGTKSNDPNEKNDNHDANVKNGTDAGTN